MMSMRTLLFVLALLTICCSFDKNLLKKRQKTADYKKHSISRRVLRFDRSAGFPQPSELPFGMLDFAKIPPDIPIKHKPSRVMQVMDVDYLPELEF